MLLLVEGRGYLESGQRGWDRKVLRPPSGRRLKLKTRLHQCLGSEKAHGIDVDDKNDCIGRKCTHARRHHATEEYGRALGTPTPQDTVHHSGISPPSSCLVNVAVRLQPALNHVDGNYHCPRNYAGYSTGDKVDYEWRVGVKG